MQRPVFSGIDDYGPRFTDAEYWRPYVREVCRRHGLAPCARIETGLAGTMPVFLVERRWVVKLFGDLFSGAQAFAIERDCYALTAAAPQIDAPRQVAEGELFDSGDAWRWPYLVSTMLPGQALVSVYDEVDSQSRAELAAYVGRQLRALHDLPLDAARTLRPDWAPFAAWVARQHAACAERHRQRGDIPAHLAAQIPGFLPAPGELINQRLPPRLLHCDLNADHLLVERRGGGWSPSGIIDFGDAKVGDPLYELGALQIGMFRGDAALLAAFLRGYGADQGLRRDFARRALSYALLHEFDVAAALFEIMPELAELPTLDAVAQRVWDGV